MAMQWFRDPAFLWARALQFPVPLFKTDPTNPLVAVFDAKGFFLSAEAEKVYNQKLDKDGRKIRLKNLPHIYTARTATGNNFYFGISKQCGGRWKRAHAYHLGTLAYQMLGTTRYDDQDHSGWLALWFELGSFQSTTGGYTVRMKEQLVFSFFMLHAKTKRTELKQAESLLINEARRRGVRVVNKT
jgi:hypothetical protein